MELRVYDSQTNELLLITDIDEKLSIGEKVNLEYNEKETFGEVMNCTNDFFSKGAYCTLQIAFVNLPFIKNFQRLKNYIICLDKDLLIDIQNQSLKQTRIIVTKIESWGESYIIVRTNDNSIKYFLKNDENIFNEFEKSIEKIAKTKDYKIINVE